jgi:hypothetical protein
MWIIPKQLHALSGAPDTEAFLLDLNEQSQACAQSLLVRSKPSPARTWLLKWKRDSWTRHLSGRILKPSHAKLFEIAWTSLWQVIPASPSAQQESDLAQKTQDTSGLTSSDQYLLFDLDSVSLKMSRDTSRWDSPQSSAIWKSWVTKCRGEYLARVKSARLTRGSGSSSWPTIRASEHKDVGPVGSKSHGHMLGKHYLRAVVTQEESNGQAAQASSSSGGSRRESSEQWRTPCERDHHPSGLNRTRNVPQILLSHQVGRKDWRTPTVAEEKNQNTSKQIYLQNQVGAVQKQWGSPAANDANKTPHCEINSNQAGLAKSVGLEMRNSTGKLNPRWVCTLMNLPVFWVKP